MAFTKGTSAQKAIDLVTVALTSGSIKLLGPTSTREAKESATADALYLETLLADLSKAIQVMGD